MADSLDNKNQADSPEGKEGSSSSSILSAYNLHFSALRRFVVRMMGGQQDVEDVVQEAFLRAYNAESSRQISQPKSYLFRVAKNVALDQMRKTSRRPTDYLEESDISEVMTNDWTLEDEVIAQQKIGIHCEAVAALPPKCRKVYLMKKVYAMSHKSIAKELSISVSTVESHLERGFNLCSKYIEEHSGEVVMEQVIQQKKEDINKHGVQS